MKIFVTGGTGFIGSNLIKSLVKDHEVTVVGTQTEQKIPGISRFLSCSLEGIDWTAVCGQDICFHQAANNNTLDEDQKEMWRANVYGPITLFQRMADSGCQQFVYASSTAVYGNEPAPYVEDTTPINPLNAYGRSKTAFDEFAMDFAEKAKVNVVGLRYCNVYGPGEQHKGHRASMVWQLIKRIVNFRKPRLFKNGEQKRDWCYIEDVVAANLAAIYLEGSGIFNIGSGTATSFNRLVEIINEWVVQNSTGMYGPSRDPMEIEYFENPKADDYQKFTLCNIAKAKEILGWSPEYSIEKGIFAYLENSLPFGE